MSFLRVADGLMSTLRVGCLCAACALIFAVDAHAAAYSYSNATGNWSTTTNWTPNGTPNSAADTISFAVQTANRNLTQDIAAGVTVNTITYGGALGNFNRQVIVTNGITLANDGAGPGFASIVSGNTTAGANNAIFFTGAQPLTLADDLKLLVNSTVSTNVNGAIQIQVPIAGTGNITINSATSISSTNTSSPGAIYFNKDNTFIGNVLIERGLLVLNTTTTPFGNTNQVTGNVVTIGSSGNSAALLTRDNLSFVNNKIIVAATTGAETRTFGSASNSTYTVSTGNILLNGNLDLRAGNTSGTAVQTYLGDISGTGGINKTFTAIAELSGTNTYTGNTTVSAGTLLFNKEVAFYNNQQGALAGFWNASKVVVNANAVLGFNIGNAGEFTDSDILSLNALGTATGGFKTGSFLGLNPTVASYIYANPISDSNGGANSIGFVKLGSNTLVLTAPNTYTGPTSFYSGTLAVTGGDNRISTASALAFNPTNTAGSIGTFDMGTTNQTLSNLTLNTAALATPSSSTLNIVGTGTLTLGANDLSIGAGGTDALDNATGFNQVLNMTALNNFVFNNNTKNVHFGLNWVAGNRATKQTNVATVNFATNNSITAATLGFADNGGGAGGGKTTVNLGQTNIWNVGTFDPLNPNNSYLNMGVTRSDLNLQFAAGLVNPTITIRAADGTSATPYWLIGQHNDNSARTWDDVIDFSGGITDALVKTMVIGSAESSGPTRDGTVNGTFILGAGNLTVTDSLTVGAFRPTAAGNGTDTTSRGNGTFRINNAAGTLNVPTILLADAPTAAVVGAVTQTTTGVLDMQNGTIKATTITKGSTVGNTMGGVVAECAYRFHRRHDSEYRRSGSGNQRR